jgi:hypothetical protein
MRTTWIALGMILCYAAWGQSQPTPTKSEHASQEQSHTADCTEVGDMRCADSRQLSPTVVVNVAPSLPGNETAPNHKSDNSSSDIGGWSVHDPNSTIAIFTIVLALVGIGQVCVARLQWITYKAQTDIFKTQNRAFVFLEKLEWEPMAITDNRESEWRAIAIVKNSGNTPARDLLMEIQKIGITDSLLDVFSFAPNYKTAKKIFIGPQTSVRIDGPRFSIRDIERSNSAEEKRHFLIWGWLEYDDVFPSTERHRTEFCMDLSADLVVDLEANTHQHMPRFVMHPSHNGADSECMHQPKPYQQPS